MQFFDSADAIIKGKGKFAAVGARPKIQRLTTLFFPLLCLENGKTDSRRSAASFFRMERADGTNTWYLIGLFYDGKKFATECANVIATGYVRFPNEPQKDKTLYIKRIKDACKSEEERDIALALMGKYTDAQPCNLSFGVVCDHVAEFIAFKEKDIAEECENLVSFWNGKSASGPRPAMEKAKAYAFKKHILIEGEKGSGKTFGIHSVVDKGGWRKVFLGGHEGIESIDLLGHLIPYSEPKKGQSGLFEPQGANSSLVWLDGALTDAFRSAAKGVKTVLFIDEMLRIPKRELNILVAALSPDNKGFYTLRTNRAIKVENGIAVEETLSVPSSNLWVVGTTNVGAGYAVDEIDEALSDRFRVILKDNDRDDIEGILLEAAATKGLEEFVPKLLRFYDHIENGRAAGSISRILNLRHLREVLDLAESADDIRPLLSDLIPTLVERDMDGKLVKEQAEYVRAAIGKALVD
jgi:MoxR-like ATPase